MRERGKSREMDFSSPGVENVEKIYIDPRTSAKLDLDGKSGKGTGKEFC